MDGSGKRLFAIAGLAFDQDRNGVRGSASCSCDDCSITGLHAKTAVVDRRYLFIGSMNLDPRSSRINTEMGAFVDSPELAEDLARIIERDMSGENAWHVRMDDEGEISWRNSDQTLTEQPARDTLQRVMNILLKIGPEKQFNWMPLRRLTIKMSKML